MPGACDVIYQPSLFIYTRLCFHATTHKLVSLSNNSLIMSTQYVFVLKLLAFKTYLQVAGNCFSLAMFVSRLSFDLWTRVMVIFNPIKYMSGRSTCPCNLQSRICCRLSIYSDYHQIMTSNDNYLHISIVTHFWDFLITTLYYDDASC